MWSKAIGSLRFTALEFVLVQSVTLDYFTTLLRVFLKWYLHSLNSFVVPMTFHAFP